MNPKPQLKPSPDRDPLQEDILKAIQRLIDNTPEQSANHAAYVALYDLTASIMDTLKKD